MVRTSLCREDSRSAIHLLHATTASQQHTVALYIHVVRISSKCVCVCVCARSGYMKICYIVRATGIVVCTHYTQLNSYMHTKYIVTR